MLGVRLQNQRQTLQDYEKAFSELSSLSEAGLRSLQSPLLYRSFVRVT